MGAARSRLAADSAHVNIQQSQLNPIRPEIAALDRSTGIDPEVFERMRVITLLQWLSENVRSRPHSGDPLLNSLQAD